MQSNSKRVEASRVNRFLTHEWPVVAVTFGSEGQRS